MNDIASSTDAIKRSGEVLFTLGVFLALSIYILNSSLAERRRLFERHLEREEMYAQMIQRLRSLRAKDAKLFETLTVASITWIHFGDNAEVRYPTLARTVPVGSHSKARAYVDIAPERLSAFNEAARVFGGRAAAVFAIHSVSSDRSHELAKIAAETFAHDKEAALFVATEVVPRLAEIDMPSQWDQVAWWIAFDRWPEPGGMHNDGMPGITYGERIKELPSEFSLRFHAYRLILYTLPPSSPDQALFQLWQPSDTDLPASEFASPRIGVPTIGLSVPAETIVAIATPLLTLLQLIFLVHWSQRTRHEVPGTDAFAFPLYGSPHDPLDGPVPQTLAAVVQRFLWFSFLVLPLGLLSIGVLSRYDVTYPMLYFGTWHKTTLFAAELQARSEDLMSTIVDLVTFVCLALSAIVVSIITRARTATISARLTLNRAQSMSIAVILSFICIYVTWGTFKVYTAPLGNPEDVHFSKMHYLMAFGILCSVWSGIGYYRRARLVTLLAIAGLAVFAAHFVPI
jgi:hypothetical protein